MNASNWISVEEYLPPVGLPVLIHAPYYEYTGLTIGALYQPADKRRKPYWQWLAYWVDSRDSGYIYPAPGEPICPGSEYVTHWMPLPDPPTEGAKIEKCVWCPYLKIAYEDDPDYKHLCKARCTATPRNRQITWATSTYKNTPQGFKLAHKGMDRVKMELEGKLAPKWCPRLKGEEKK